MKVMFYLEDKQVVIEYSTVCDQTTIHYNGIEVISVHGPKLQFLIDALQNIQKMRYKD